jgi:hypothetical protein
MLCGWVTSPLHLTAPARGRGRVLVGDSACSRQLSCSERGRPQTTPGEPFAQPVTRPGPLPNRSRRLPHDLNAGSQPEGDPDLCPGVETVVEVATALVVE